MLCNRWPPNSSAVGLYLLKAALQLSRHEQRRQTHEAKRPRLGGSDCSEGAEMGEHMGNHMMTAEADAMYAMLNEVHSILLVSRGSAHPLTVAVGEWIESRSCPAALNGFGGGGCWRHS
eukprot:SAG11_NODE_3382_length_2485_cov_1.076278_1_plen_119_part_00